MPIDRAAVVRRHNPRVTRIDPTAALSLGNGEFGFTADVTGLQSLDAAYRAFPTCTTAHWAWHTAPMPAGARREDFRFEPHNAYGRPVPYRTSKAGQEPLYEWLRANPHRLHLGRLGIDGAAVADLSGIHQDLDLWTGLLTSRFELHGVAAIVETAVHPLIDAVAVRLSRPLPLAIAFPYGSPALAMADWGRASAHHTLPRSGTQRIDFDRQLDSDRYHVAVAWSGEGSVRRRSEHDWLLEGTTEFVCWFGRHRHDDPLPSVAECFAASARAWESFWSDGAALDLGACTDQRAPELERRIVLSQYQTAVHCSGSLPSQETGLLFNSWNGKFHLEMHWWHSVHFVPWARANRFERSLSYYHDIIDQARALARQQGYSGARWPKMVGPDGHDAPSPVGPLLCWQQPHPIYYAELCYRLRPGAATLEAWREIVSESAEFMASYAVPDHGGRYVLGPPLKPASENQPAETCCNPAFELSYWRTGLRLAQIWRERLGQPRHPEWDRVLRALAPLPVADGVYLMQEGLTDTYTRFNWEHPSLVGALGMLPGDGVDAEVMRRTVRRVAETWQWDRCWGWDFPMMAMAAARCGEPELAVDALLVDSPKNRYLPNGHCWQRESLPAYLPGNGGLLAAVAMMSGGWTGGPAEPLPGWPRNGLWQVRAEGFGVWL